MDPYQNLANAVVLTAVKDYRAAKKRLSRGRKNTEAERMKAECEMFFTSEYFNVFTDIDGKALLEKLKQEEIT